MGRTVPSRSRFQDDAQHAAAVASMVRDHRFAVVRRQVRKAQVRATLWPRLGTCCRLLGPVSFAFSIHIVVTHVVSFMEVP